jgi:hypothetical protein
MPDEMEIPFKFGLSPSGPAITAESELWSALLPLEMRSFQGAPAQCDQRPAPTYGDYFKAARNFLLRDNMALPLQAAGKVLGRAVAIRDVEGVGVYLVKHGAFYHPARIEISIAGHSVPMVLNVAVAARGRRTLPLEINAMSRLRQTLSTSYWPVFYGFGYGKTGNGRQWPMLLGDWLEGYYEFHLTENTASGEVGVVVWDSDRGHHILDSRQVHALAGKAAELLTYAYNPLTFEAILDWHHAAGDFVIQVQAGEIDLRMITVRDYAPLAADTPADIPAVLDAMVVFLVGLSLRLRLDRLDGVGCLALYPPWVVPDIWKGFCRGLHSGNRERGLPVDFDAAVMKFVRLQGKDRLMPIAEAVIHRYPDNSETRNLLLRKCTDHVQALWDAVLAHL